MQRYVTGNFCRVLLLKRDATFPGLFCLFCMSLKTVLFFNFKKINMKKIVFAVLAITFILSGYAQSDKNLQKRQVSGFHGVDVSGGIDLYLSDGPESVAISASSTDVR